MLEEDVHRLPERVIENFDQLLMNEGILRNRVAKVGAFYTRQRERHRFALACCVQRSPYFGVAFGRTEAHDHVVAWTRVFSHGSKAMERSRAGSARFPT